MLEAMRKGKINVTKFIKIFLPQGTSYYAFLCRMYRTISTRDAYSL